MHLGLAILSLAAGFIVTKQGLSALKGIINTGLLFLAATSLVFYCFEVPPFLYITNFLYDASNHLLLFSATLVCGYAFLQDRNSSLTVVISLLAASAPILGVLLEKYFFLRLPTNAMIGVLLVGCVLSAWFVHRFFPLLIAAQPVLPSIIEEAASTGIQKYSPEDLKHFAARHKLNKREIQVLEMLLRGLTSVEMVEAIGLKQSTVRTYTQNLLKKTKTNSRLELVTVFLTQPDKQD